jgi:hypothetical protein
VHNPASSGKPAHGPPPSGPSGNPASGIIKPSNAGKCNPVGATGMLYPHRVFFS